MTQNGDVVIVGGGIAGICTAYYLAKAGIRSTVIERDSVGSHASGFAYGGLSPLAGAGIPGPVFALSDLGIRLHRELAKTLPEETGVNTEFRVRPSLSLSFTDEEVSGARSVLDWQQKQEGFTVQWLDADDVHKIEPRVSDQAIGGVYVEGTADVEPYRLVLALAQASEKLGATIRHGNVTGLERSGGGVSAVITETGRIPCDTVVLAIGPWSGGISDWLGTPISVRPLKGQILRLRAPGAPYTCSIGWDANYATTKPDGLLWTGTTEEEVGFNESQTTQARDEIMASLLKMVPSLSEAQLVQQTACLRPVSSDGFPILGPAPGWDGVYVVTGGGRKGILLGPAMAQITSNLIAGSPAGIQIEAFDPGRFS